MNTTIENVIRRPYSWRGRKSDIAGKKYGKLTAIEPVGFAGAMAVWSFACECGEVVERRAAQVTYAARKPGPRTASRLHCGCGSRYTKWSNSTDANHSAYQAWRNLALKDRLSREWLDFDRFLDECWSEREPGLHLVRLDRSDRLSMSNFLWSEITEKGWAELEDFVALSQKRLNLSTDEAWCYATTISRQARHQRRLQWQHEDLQGPVANGRTKTGVGVRGGRFPPPAIRTPDLLPASHSADQASRFSGTLPAGVLPGFDDLRPSTGDL